MSKSYIIKWLSERVNPNPSDNNLFWVGVKKKPNKIKKKVKKISKNKVLKSKSRAEARKMLYHIKECQLCNGIQRLQVHHKDKNPLNNELNNLIKLCVECHIKQHIGDTVYHLMKNNIF